METISRKALSKFDPNRTIFVAVKSGKPELLFSYGIPIILESQGPPPSGPPRWNFENLKKTYRDIVAKSKHRKFHQNRSIRKYLKLGGKYGVGKKKEEEERKKERINGLKSRISKIHSSRTRQLF